MYIQTRIAKLSRNQLKNLLEGKKGVRIREGTTHHIHLTEPQFKKFKEANNANKAYTVKFTPHQAKHQGAGLFQDVYNYVKRTPYIRKATSTATITQFNGSVGIGAPANGISGNLSITSLNVSSNAGIGTAINSSYFKY